MSAIVIPVVIVALTVVAMELLAAWVHEKIMHGPGWAWHKSHHVPHDKMVEHNDLYSVVFAVISMALLWLGSLWVPPLWWVGIGLCVYGALYYVLHDGLVHQRWPFRYVPRSGYLRRIYQAHRLHHAVQDKDGAVSFGFVLVAPPEKLRQDLRRKQASKGGVEIRRTRPGQRPDAGGTSHGAALD